LKQNVYSKKDSIFAGILFVDDVYEKFNAERKKYELEQEDKQDLEELKQLENEIKKR